MRRFLISALFVIVLSGPALAVDLTGKTITATRGCLDLEHLRFIVSEYQHSTEAGNTAFMDMVRGGVCAIVPGGFTVKVVEKLDKVEIGEPAHIWRGESNGVSVYMLISDKFKLPGKGV